MPEVVAILETIKHFVKSKLNSEGLYQLSFLFYIQFLPAYISLKQDYSALSVFKRSNNADVRLCNGLSLCVLYFKSALTGSDSRWRKLLVQKYKCIADHCIGSWIMYPYHSDLHWILYIPLKHSSSKSAQSRTGVQLTGLKEIDSATV